MSDVGKSREPRCKCGEPLGADLRGLRARAPFVVDGYAPFDGDVVYFGMGGQPGITMPRSLAVVVYNAENDFWALHSVTSAAAWKLHPKRCHEALKRHQAHIATLHGLGLVELSGR